MLAIVGPTDRVSYFKIDLNKKSPYILNILYILLISFENLQGLAILTRKYVSNYHHRNAIELFIFHILTTLNSLARHVCVCFFPFFFIKYINKIYFNRNNMKNNRNIKYLFIRYFFLSHMLAIFITDDNNNTSQQKLLRFFFSDIAAHKIYCRNTTKI